MGHGESAVAGQVDGRVSHLPSWCQISSIRLDKRAEFSVLDLFNQRQLLLDTSCEYVGRSCHNSTYWGAQFIRHRNIGMSNSTSLGLRR